MRPSRLGFLLLPAFLLSACWRIGPDTVARDRFDYMTAIGESWKSQMLLNLVKIRYGDALVFLEVSSLLAQYEMSANANLGGNWTEAAPPLWGATIGGAGTYADRPSITYSPMLGEQFGHSLMTPIPPSAVFSLIQAGYPADYIMRLTVHGINDLLNRSGGEDAGERAGPDFFRLAELLREQQKRNLVGLSQSADGEVFALFRATSDPQATSREDEIRALLGLDRKLSRFPVIYGSQPTRKGQEIAVLTRSVLDVLGDLAAYIDVPERHIRENRAYPSSSGGKTALPALLRIRSGPDKPKDVYAAVPYRDHWFWIDDRDVDSKSMFSFLMFVFTLVDNGNKAPMPTLTIPSR